MLEQDRVPPAVSYNVVQKFLFVNIIVIPSASTGNDNISKIAVMKIAQQNSCNDI